MNSFNGLVLAYLIGLGGVWGYALLLWKSIRNAQRRATSNGGES